MHYDLQNPLQQTPQRPPAGHEVSQGTNVRQIFDESSERRIRSSPDYDQRKAEKSPRCTFYSTLTSKTVRSTVTLNRHPVSMST